MPTKTDALTGKVAVITGAAGGIGEAIAQRFAHDGAHVVINDLNAERAEHLAQQLIRHGYSASAAAGNIADEQQVRELIDNVTREHGHLDVMVNNAGIENAAALRKVDLADWQRVLDVNLTGVLLGCRAASQAMSPDAGGRIINISSRAWLGWWGQASYAASKGGVVSLTRALAIELARRRITVNCIAPGLIDTPMFRALPEHTQDTLIEAQPTKTIGHPADVAHLARFIADDNAKSITGHVLYACGGKSLFAMPPQPQN